MSLGLLLIYRIEGIYNYVRGRSWLEEMYGLLTATFTGIVILVFIFFFFRPQFYSRLIYIYAGILIVILLTLARVVTRMVLGYYAQARHWGRPRARRRRQAKSGALSCAMSSRSPTWAIRSRALWTMTPAKAAIGNFPLLGGTDQLPRILRERSIDEVLITLPWHARDKIVQIMESSRSGWRARQNRP